MSKTKELRDDLLLDLADITQANGFNHDLGTISREPVRYDDVQTTTGAAIYSGPGGDSEPESLTNTLGLASHTFIVRLFTRTSTPNQDMDNLTDDVRNAVERITGYLVTDANVEMVTAAEWTELQTEEGIHADTYIRDVSVNVRYYYNRGDL